MSILRGIVGRFDKRVVLVKHWPAYGYAQNVRAKSSFDAFTNFLGEPSMFSMATVKKNYELVPLLAIMGVGMLLEAIVIIRTAVTRDDVRWYPKGRMAFEKYDKVEKGDRAPRRKLIVRHQKIEWDDKLVDALAALREPTEEEKKKMEAEKQKKK